MQSLIKGRSLFVANNARHLIASSSLSSTTSHVISSSLICNNNNNITNTLFNNQVRHGGKHLPVNLKGRRGWQKVIEAKKKKAVLTKKLGGAAIKQEYLKDEKEERRWSPESPIEIAYTKYMRELNQTRKRHSSVPVEELISLSKTEADLQFALRVWRVLSFRNIKFKNHTTLVMLKKFVQLGDVDSAVDLLMNAHVLRMPVDTEALFFVIDQLLAAGDVARAVEVFSLASKGKFSQVVVNEQVLNQFVSALKAVDGDQNEHLIKAVAPLGKPRGLQQKAQVASTFVAASNETKVALIDACKAVKNEESPVIVKLLQLAVLDNAELSNQLAELIAPPAAEAKEEAAAEE